MTTTTENAPSLSGNSAEGDDRNLGKGTTMNNVTSVPLAIDTLRFIAIDGDVYDQETGLVVGFSSTADARLGAEWMNTGNATISDYAWIETPPTGLDEGPYISDVLRAADILGLKPSDLMGALAPLFLAKRDLKKAEAAK